MVSGRTWSEGRPIIEQVSVDSNRGAGHSNHPRWQKPIVPHFVPFIAQQAGFELSGLSGCERVKTGIAPKSQLSLTGRNKHRIGPKCVDLIKLSRDCIFGATAVGRWAKTRIAPRAGPLRARVNLCVRPRLLVTDQCAIGRARSGNAVFPARSPKHLVPTEESEMDSSCPRRLDIGALLSGPIFIMTNRQEDLMLCKSSRASPIGIDAGRVAYIVTIGFKPTNHRILRIE
jgi:hypothetical protein